LTTLDEFRSAIFHRLLDEMDLTGSRFPINPPRPVLELIAILGPVDVERPDFQESARQLLQRPVDEILSTIDALAATGNQARFTLEKTKACLAVRVATGGFHRFMLTFVDRPDFLAVMADDIIRDEEIKQLSSQLASVLNAIHMSQPEVFRQRALAAIEAGASEVIHAAANNLRVFSGATEEDIAVIQAYAGYADPVAKLGAIFAITYMGKFTDLLPALKEAVLSVRTEGNNRVAAELADAFGPYGVPLTSLTRDEAAGLMKEFAGVRDWDFDQGAIARFLNRFVNLFPDETFDVLTDRVERNSIARAANLPGLRTFGLVHGDVSFSNVPPEKRMGLAAKVLTEEVVEHFVGEDENHQQTPEEVLAAALATVPDEKLTSFALRLALTGYVTIPRENELDYLAEAEAAFVPPQPTKQKKPKKAPTPIKAVTKKTVNKKKLAA
jgi:hypothetical protein